MTKGKETRLVNLRAKQAEKTLDVLETKALTRLAAEKAQEIKAMGGKVPKHLGQSVSRV
jgi:hypothetical protein